jgi:DNA helicase-2/ATP-dependent DNA helicase PcrA
MQVIIGPPGTGKTTTLLGIVEGALARGVPAARIGLVSFTKAAVTEAIERAARRFGLDPKEFRYFRTLHSLGYELTGRESKVATETMIEAWQRGEGYGGQVEREAEGWDGGRGDDAGLHAVWELSRALRVPPRQAVGRWQGGAVDWRSVERYGQRYTQWKQGSGVIDFTDMLERSLVVEPPALEVLAVDEAQDLSPLQQALAARLLGAAREAYVVGDDDQAIHSWAGADYRYLLGLAQQHGHRTLAQSYRVPRLAHRMAQRIVGRVRTRIAKQYDPRQEMGAVRAASWDRYLAARLAQGAQDGGAVLCRTRRQVGIVGRWLLEAGIPYRSERGGVDPLGAERQLEAAVAVRRVQAGLRLRAVDLGALAAHIRAGLTAGLGRGTLARLRRVEGDPTDGDLEDLGAGPLLGRVRAEGMQSLDGVEPESRAYYHRVLGVDGTVPSALTLTTCHASKGREWTSVFIDSTLTKYQAAAIEAGDQTADDEHRVAYVAATRTKRDLTIIAPTGRNMGYPYPGAS